MMGYGAVKYADLKSNRINNYVFSYDRMLDDKGEGNAGGRGAGRVARGGEDSGDRASRRVCGTGGGGGPCRASGLHTLTHGLATFSASPSPWHTCRWVR